MPFFMLEQPIVGRKTTFAVRVVAFERPLSVVHPHMSQQISFLPKRLLAVLLRAYKWPLASVKPHVDL